MPPALFRAHRYGADGPGLAGRDLDPARRAGATAALAAGRRPY